MKSAAPFTRGLSTGILLRSYHAFFSPPPQVKAALAGTPAANLSLSDLVAICGARAVSICGGPVINVLVGRVDAATAAGADPEGRLPAESLSADQLKASFAGKGFSVQEMIALSGGVPFTHWVTHWVLQGMGSGVATSSVLAVYSHTSMRCQLFQRSDNVVRFLLCISCAEATSPWHA